MVSNPAVSSVYKRAMHAFLLKVHPDFFSAVPELQRKNEASVAKLNELLMWARDVKSGSSYKPPPAPSMAFHFVRKPDSVGGRPGSTSDQLSAVFALPKDLVVAEATKGQVERHVNKFLRDLLRRADCLDVSEASASTAEDETIRRAELRPKGAKPRPKMQQVRTLLDETLAVVEAFGEGISRSSTPAPAIDELIQSDQVLFDKGLTPQQCARAIATLATHLPQMRYDEWNVLPLLISDRFDVGRPVVGTLSVPFDVTLEQFLGFLSKQASAIAECRRHIESIAGEVEQLVAEISRGLNLDDVLITCPHRSALPFLRMLKEELPHLSYVDVRDVTLEIGDHNGYRANGVVILDHKMDGAQLRKKLAII